MTSGSSDRIEKQVTLRAPVARVWRALTDADRVPTHRRRRAFLMNDGGWTAQAENLRAHVEAA